MSENVRDIHKMNTLLYFFCATCINQHRLRLRLVLSWGLTRLCVHHFSSIFQTSLNTCTHLIFTTYACCQNSPSTFFSLVDVFAFATSSAFDTNLWWTLLMNLVVFIRLTGSRYPYRFPCVYTYLLCIFRIIIYRVFFSLSTLLL